jgi:molecular chaperone GrpE
LDGTAEGETVVNQEEGNQTIAELPAGGDPVATTWQPIAATAEVVEGAAVPVGSASADASPKGEASLQNASAGADPTELDSNPVVVIEDDGESSEPAPAASVSDVVAEEQFNQGTPKETTGAALPSVREKLIAQFEQWLDRMAEGEPPPEGIPQEIINEAGLPQPQGDGLSADLYSLFSALTTLSGEVRLQGRTFKGLTDALAPIAQLPGRLDRIETAQGIVVQDLARRAAAESQAAGPKSKEVLAAMFDLYDRLERGMRTFETSVESLRAQTFTGWRQRLLGGAEQAKALLDSAEAIEEGYRLTLSRLDAAFTQWGVERIAAEGEMFDPELMAVIEVQPSPGAADGTVLEVYKSGYLLHGQMLATAQVKVCRNP